jgi:hypothetical protein
MKMKIEIMKINTFTISGGLSNLEKTNLQEPFGTYTRSFYSPKKFYSYFCKNKQT